MRMSDVQNMMLPNVMFGGGSASGDGGQTHHGPLTDVRLG
jgi:hypothetical protein